MRRLSLFALIFITLAGLYWLLERPVQQRSRESAQLFAGFDPAAAARITITAPDKGTLVLQRSGGLWQVSSSGQEAAYAADTQAVQALLDTLASLATGSRVSRTPGRHALYEVDQAKGLRVEALDSTGRAAAAVVIGKNGPNIFSTFVRASGSDEVYLVDGILQARASKTLSEWRDKTVFKLDPGLIRAYTVSGDRSLALHKNGDAWQAGSGETVNAEAARQLMQTLAGLNAADFAEGTLEEFGLGKPARTITAELSDERSATLLIGRDANAFQQYAKTADADTVYIIEKHLLDALCPTLEELNTPQPAPDAVLDAGPAAKPPSV